jgi:hypothetical protein
MYRGNQTISVKKMSVGILKIDGKVYEGIPHWRPVVRGDCVNSKRPCPFVGCKHHLFLDVNEEIGSIKLNFPGLEPWEIPQTCMLDVADRPGGITLEEVGRLMNITRERVRQIEEKALANFVEAIKDDKEFMEAI